MPPVQNADAIFIKLGVLEVSAYGSVAIITVVVLAVLIIATRWLMPRW